MPRTKKHATRSKSRQDDLSVNVESIIGKVWFSLSETKAKIRILRSHNKMESTSLHAAQNDEGSEQNQHSQKAVLTQELSTIEEEEEEVDNEEQHEEKTTEQQMMQQHPTPPPSPRAPLTISSFEFGRPLGRGKFGQVFLARHIESNYVCAIKTLSKAQCTSHGGENLVRRELEVHQNLAHPHILRFHTWLDDTANIYLILEYAPNGNLFRHLRSQPHGRFGERQVAVYISQMAQALQYLHSKNVMHRDIKPENILLGLHNEIKLADFGYSVHTRSGMRSTVCGTLDYLSPEVVLMMLKPGKAKQWYTKAIDQWGLGVLTYELLVGWPPFERPTETATQKKIANFRGKVRFPTHVSKPAEEFVLKLLDIDAERRMGFDDVLVHPWIKGHLEEHGRTVLRLQASGRAAEGVIHV